METPWLKISEAAEYLQVSVPTLRKWRAKGLIAAFQIPGTKVIRFRKEDLDKFLLLRNDATKYDLS